MIGGLERRVILKLFPSSPKMSEEVVEIPVEYGVKLAIHAKNTKRRGEVIFTPQGQIIFRHDIAKVRAAPGSEASFEFIETDGPEDEGLPDRRRVFRLKPGGVLGLWPRENQTDRIMYEGRRFLRLEASAMIAE